MYFRTSNYAAVQWVLCCAAVFFSTALPCGAEVSYTLPAGAASIKLRKPLRLNRPAPNIPLVALKDFHLGRSFFQLPWIPSPASTTVRDGLGPLFNVNTCRACHVVGGKGPGPKSSGPLPDAAVVRFSNGAGGDPTYGRQLQPRSVGIKDNSGLSFDGEGRIAVRYRDKHIKYPDGHAVTLRTPVYHIEKLRYGPLASDTKLSTRVGPSLVGLGLLEAISDEDIIENEDPQDENKDGVSGRVHYVSDPKQKTKKLIGRFGHKAQQVGLLQQTAHAFRNDIGITSSLFPIDNCERAQKDCVAYSRATTPGSGVEIDEQILGAVTSHVRLFAVPVRRGVRSEAVQLGETLFKKASCHTCHTPSFTTTKESVVKEFSNLDIFPYSDLLLHDMGDELADGVIEGNANGREWRTPPLWAIGLNKHVNPDATFLHDGRARTLEEAILWHGGEAERSRKKFMNFSATQREALIRFLNSI